MKNSADICYFGFILKNIKKRAITGFFNFVTRKIFWSTLYEIGTHFKITLSRKVNVLRILEECKHNFIYAKKKLDQDVRVIGNVLLNFFLAFSFFWPTVIIEKSRGGRFLWNRNWDLGWIWAGLATFEAVFSCFHGQKKIQKPF